MKEAQIIKMMNNTIARKCQSLDKNIQDAIPFFVNKNKLLFTIDDFSGEDQFRENLPYFLGLNMVIGSVSDILASGGIPKFYGHSLVVSENWSKEYIKKFSDGIAEAISTTGMTFIGGDIGKSDSWKYTASVIGEAPEKKLNRVGANPGDLIYLSGKLGAGNFEAALNLYQETFKLSGLLQSIRTKFPYRFEHSQLIRDFANCAIDTSDGVFNGLNTLAELNGVGYEISNLPYIKKAVILAKLLSMPKELLFLGECGEYELLFCVNEDVVNDFETKANNNNLLFYPIGRITEKTKILHSGSQTIDLETIDFHARDFKNPKEYLTRLIEKLKV